MTDRSYCQVTIQVSGPGMLVNYDAELIRRSLELAGFTVTLINNYSIEEQVASGAKPMTVTEYMDTVNGRDVKLAPVTMIVDNQPWGG